MNLDRLLSYLKSKSTEDKSIIVSKEEMDKALKGEIIPTVLDNYSTMTLEMLKLSTDDKKYYKDFYNKLIEKNNANITFRVNVDNSYKEDYEFNKFKIIDALEWAKDNNKLTLEEIEKLKLLKMSVSFANFKDKYKGETASSIIEGKFISLPVQEFIDVMTTSQNNINEMLKACKYKDIDLDIFVYALDDFLDKTKILERFHIPKKVSVNLNMLRENVDIAYLNRCLEYEHTYLSKVKVNEELKQKILEGMNEDFDDLEKAFYIYYRMCNLLTYDDEYFAKRNMHDENKHKDFSRLNTITPDNNIVICYEFNAIYARMLKDLGIKYELNGNLNYGEGHASLTFRINKFIVTADSTVGLIKSDLAYAKNGLILTGFTLENTNKSTYDKFVYKIDKVYDYIRNNSNLSSNFEGTIRELTLFERALPIDLTLEEKVVIFISMSKDSTLNTMDKIPYEIKLSKILFKKDNYKNNKFKINYISYKIDPDKEIYKTTKILTYNSWDIDNTRYNNYIFIDHNNIMHKTTLKDIKTNLLSGIYRGLLNDNHTIPGVTLDEMNGKLINQKLLDKGKSLPNPLQVEFDIKKEYQHQKKNTLGKAINTLGKIVDYNSKELGQSKTHK